jgi:hypothetical protein
MILIKELEKSTVIFHKRIYQRSDNEAENGLYINLEWNDE